MSNQPIKSASDKFTKDSFYLVQTEGNEKRYVVSLRDKVRIRTLLAGFINQSLKNVLVKIRNFEDQENPRDYSGSVEKSKMHKVMTKYEDVIFHNGFHDFMIMNPETEDYIVFDEHGLIFIYSDNDYMEVLKNLEAEKRQNEKLTYEFDHWHYCMPEGKEKLIELINELDLIKE